MEYLSPEHEIYSMGFVEPDRNGWSDGHNQRHQSNPGGPIRIQTGFGTPQERAGPCAEVDYQPDLAMN